MKDEANRPGLKPSTTSTRASADSVCDELSVPWTPQAGLISDKHPEVKTDGPPAGVSATRQFDFVQQWAKHVSPCDEPLIPRSLGSKAPA